MHIKKGKIKEKRNETMQEFIKKHKMGIVVAISAIIMVIGLSFAWLQITLRGSKELSMMADGLKLVLDDTMEGGIHLENAIPVTDEEGLTQVGYTFTLENTGKVDSSYEIYLDDLDLDEGQTRMRDDFLKYQLVKNGEEVSLALLSTTGENPNRLLDKGAISSDTNGKGVYTFSSTKDDKYPVHYYRGAVTDNNVKFAGLCWKIVRTTNTGGIKLIYNGSPDTNGKCTNTTGEATQIGKSAFNEIANSKESVGYMAGNTSDSTIKKVIDTWYRDNMTEYTEKLEDAVWCNDRGDGSINNPYQI